MKRRILITGAGGFLGSRLFEYFKNKDEYETIPVVHRELDITDSEAVTIFFKTIQPEVVLHCAAVSNTGECEANPQQSESVNVQGTANVARACRESNSKLIFMSSDQIYTGADSLEPNREDDRIQPSNVYGKDKKRAENAVFTYLKNAVALRLTWMYDYPVKGRVESSNLLRALLCAKEEGTAVSYPVHDYRGITYVWDVVRRMEQAMGLPGGIYNFGSENGRNVYETALLFAQAVAGKEKAASLVNPDKERFAAMPRNLMINTEKLKAQGIIFGDTAEGLLRCCQDYGIR